MLLYLNGYILLNVVTRVSVLMQIRGACLIIALCLPRPAAAQTVRVAVVNRATQAPVAGAITSLVDTAGTRVTARLTDERGEVTLLGRTGMRVRLVVETIGYISERTATFELPAGTTERLIAMEARPLVLEKVAVRDRSRCDGGPQGASAATLWEEARKALTASTLTAQRAPPLVLSRYVRRVDLSHRVIAETTSTRAALGSTFAAASARVLSTEGFTRDVGGTSLYFAPDAELLLDPAFVQTHCFSVRELDGSNRLVGLTFAPTPGRSNPDIEGVLWIERASGSLRWLEFTYSRQPAGAGEDKAGGRVEFERLPSGAWVIQRWHVRLPVLARTRATQVGRVTIAQRDTVIGFREEGGWLSPADAGTDSTATTTLSGVVFDSLRSLPLANVRIVLGGGAAESRTDSSGRFIIRHVLPGRYLVRAEHPRLTAFASDIEREVVLTPGRTSTISWTVPAASTLRDRLCQTAAPRVTAVIVRVVNALSGLPIEGADAQARWQTVSLRSVDRTSIASSTDSIAASRTDDRGLAAFCISGREGRVTLRAEHDGREVERTIFLPDSVMLSETELLLPASATRGFRMRGRVVNTASNAPAVAEVLLPALGRTVSTSADGTFDIGGLPAGAFALIIRSPGYQPHFTRVLIPVGDSLRSYGLERLPQSLQPITVEGMRDIRSFEERRAVQAGGSYLSRQDLSARESSRLSDILRSMPGIRIERRPDGSNVIVSSRGVFSRSVRTCPYQIILDGQRLFALRSGGSEGASVPPSIDDFVPAHLEGIEIYTGPANTPSQFGGLGAACGTIILWTRRNPP